MDPLLTHDSEPALPRLKKRTVLWYSLPQLAGIAASLVSGGLLTKFYTDTLKAPIASVGVATFLAGVLASYAQLLLGYISDRTRTRWGRRRPYIVLGAPLYAAAFLFLMFPPDVTGAAAAAWFAVFLTVLVVAGDLLSVAQNALGTELTQNDVERTRLYSWAQVAGVVGLIVLAGVQGPVTHALGERGSFRVLGVGVAACIVVTNLLLACNVRESKSFFKRAALPLIPGFRSCSHNRPWLTFLLSGTMLSLMNEITGLFTFLLAYVIRVNSDDWFGPAAGTYALSQMIGVPAANWAARRWGKLPVYRASMALVLLYSLASYLATQPGATDPDPHHAKPVLFLLALSIFGFALGGVNVLGSVIESDCIDYDELHTGKRRESTYHSLSNLPGKAASIAGKAVPLMCLRLTGFVPNVDQNDGVIFVLRFFTCLLPGILCALALVLFRSYAIDEEKHAAIMAAIQRRRAGEKDVVDPMTGRLVVDSAIASRVAAKNTIVADDHSPSAKSDTTSPGAADRMESVDVETGGGRGGDADAGADADDVGGDKVVLTLGEDMTPAEVLALRAADAAEDTRVENFLLYFSRNDLRMLASSWRKRFVTRFVSTMMLWGLHMVIASVAAARLLASGVEDAKNAGFLAVLAAATFSLVFAYQLARLKGVKWLLAQTPSKVAAYVAAYTDVLALRHGTAGTNGSGSGTGGDEGYGSYGAPASASDSRPPSAAAATPVRSNNNSKASSFKDDSDSSDGEAGEIRRLLLADPEAKSAICSPLLGRQVLRVVVVQGLAVAVWIILLTWAAKFG